MALSYDGDELAEVPAGMREYAIGIGCQVVNVICHSKAEGPFTGVNYFAIVQFLPRPGDIIDLDDGTRCEVKRVMFKSGRHGPFPD